MHTRIIYIIGLGRSGTTLLDIVLGNAANTLSCGELNRYPYEKGYPYQYPEDHPAQRLWTGLRDEFEALNPEINWGRMTQLHRKFEFHERFILNYFKLYSRKDFSDYIKFVEDVYELIAKRTGAATLIDSSKYAGRALSLSRSEKLGVSYLYIKRRPSAVVNSFSKKDVEQNSKSWLSANAYYFLASTLCKIAYRTLKGRHRCLSVRYEDLMSDPQTHFENIGETLGFDTSDIVKKLKNNEPFSGGTIYYGNRVRLQNEVTLRPASEKPKGLGALLTDAINYIHY